MRRLGLSLVLVVGAVAAAGAQQKNAGAGSPIAPLQGLKGAFGAPESATGGLKGVYAPPESGVGHLRGVYAPPQPVEAKPLSSSLAPPSASNSESVPNITVPGKVAVGATLPEGLKPAPMTDRPGFGRARVNDRSTIIDLNDNRIVQFTD